MATTAEKSKEHIGETRAMTDHDRDLIRELAKRLDSVWRYDQFIANAEGKSECQDLWREMKKQDLKFIDELRTRIKEEIKAECF